MRQIATIMALMVIAAAAFGLGEPLDASASSDLYVSPQVSPRIYWGALVYQQAPSTYNMRPGGPFDLFERDAGKRMSVLHWGQPWVMNGSWQAFQPSWFDNVRNHGSIPYITWGSWQMEGRPNQPSFANRVIYNGTYDAFIKQWALAAKAWGHPFFLRFDWEMNAWWYP